LQFSKRTKANFLSSAKAKRKVQFRVNPLVPEEAGLRGLEEVELEACEKVRKPRSEAHNQQQEFAPGAPENVRGIRHEARVGIREGLCITVQTMMQGVLNDL
jgi:hypothetical protein